MLRTLSAAFLLLLLYACQPPPKFRAGDITHIDSLISKYLEKKNIDSLLAAAEKKLTILRNNPDSLHAYVNFNQWLIDWLYANGRGWSSTKRYEENIITLAEKYPADPQLQYALTNACYYWADNCKDYDQPADSVIRYFEKAIELNHKTKALLPENKRLAYKALGILYNILGDIKRSLGYYDLQTVMTAGKSNSKAALAINISIALRESGLTDSAIHVILAVLPLSDIDSLKRGDMLTTLSEAQLQKGLTADAEKSAEAALRILTSLPATAEVKEKTAMALKQKGLLEKIKGLYTPSIRDLAKALHYYPKKDRKSAKIYIELGKSHEAAGGIDSALHYCQVALSYVAPVDSGDILALPDRSQLTAENTIMEALDAKAGALVKKYRLPADIKYLETAVDCYDLAFDTERKLMQYLSYDESKLLMLQVSRERSSRAINLCWQLQQLTGNARWAGRAFLFAEKSKAFVLLESIKRNIANSALQNDSLYQRVQSLQMQLSYIEKNIFEKSLSKENTAPALLNTQKKELEGQLLLAQTTLNRNNSFYRNEMNKEDSFSVDLISQELLDNKTALLEYFSGDSAIYIFLLAKERSPVIIKAGNDLPQLIDSFLYFFTSKDRINNEPGAYQAAAHALYRQLGFSAIDPAAIKQLVIIPDGRLNFVPFEALVTSLTAAQNPRQFSYLLQQQQVVYGYSAATLLKQPEYRASRPGNIIAFAPVFAASEKRQSPLPNTGEELSDIKKQRSGGSYFLQKEATLNNFKTNAATAGIIHIATHATADTAGGTQPAIEFYDSTLYLQELYTLHINARLVVLSACETGIGAINKSEGAMSLARGFYYAGAKNIITSLWSVEDKSTATIFSYFYQHISGTNYPLALHKAKLNYLETATSSTASPYYWAGFIHIGYEKPAKKSTPLIWLLLIPLLFVLILLLKRK